MSFQTLSRQSGRRPLTIVELDLDYCQLSYGQSPCSASLGVSGPSYCYNTRPTCQDAANYDPAAKTYRFCSAAAPLPIGLRAIPSVQSVSLTPTRIDIEGGLGQRATSTIVLQDHSYHDRGLDKYWRERHQTTPSVIQASAAGDVVQADGGGINVVQAIPGSVGIAASGEDLPGTYWGRLRARNPYYLGRTCRVLTGYLDEDGGYDPANFVTRTYLLESIAGPDAAGKVTIKAKDPLKLADEDRSQAPRPSTGVLAASIDASDTAASLLPAGVGDEEYPASGYLCIGREVVSFTRSGDALTLVRAQFGTTSEEHDASDSCQLCLHYVAQDLAQIANDLLVNYTPVASAYIPLAEWEAEVAEYLPRTYTTLITAPTGASKLLEELLKQTAASMWWDERLAEIKLRALRAPDPDDLLDEDRHIVKDSLRPLDKPDLRVSQGWVYFLQRDPTDSLDDPRNYRRLILDADLESEGQDKFGVPAIKKLYSRWISSQIAAEELAENLVLRFGETPRQLSFSLDAKDSDWWTGDVVFIKSRLVLAPDGQQQPLAVQIIEAGEAEAAHRYDYVAQAFNVVAFVPTGIVITISVSDNDVNLLDLFTSLHGAPSASTVVTFVVEVGVIVGQQSAPAALRTDIWPPGAMITLEVNGRIQGKGGKGASMVTAPPVAGPGGTYASGEDGGDAMLIETLISIRNNSEIWGGGGGGGGRWNWSGIVGNQFIAGGGGAGTEVGQGGTGYSLLLPPGQADGQDGTASSGGQGGNLGTEGKAGGGPGLPGAVSGGPGISTRAPGAAGRYVVGNALVTWLADGDRRGGVA